MNKSVSIILTIPHAVCEPLHGHWCDYGATIAANMLRNHIMPENKASRNTHMPENKVSHNADNMFRNHIMPENKVLHNVIMLENKTPRIECDGNRWWCRDIKFRYDIRSHITPNTILFDIHSFPNDIDFGYPPPEFVILDTYPDDNYVFDWNVSIIAWLRECGIDARIVKGVYRSDAQIKSFIREGINADVANEIIARDDKAELDRISANDIVHEARLYGARIYSVFEFNESLTLLRADYITQCIAGWLSN